MLNLFLWLIPILSKFKLLQLLSLIRNTPVIYHLVFANSISVKIFSSIFQISFLLSDKICPQAWPKKMLSCVTLLPKFSVSVDIMPGTSRAIWFIFFSKERWKRDPWHYTSIPIMNQPTWFKLQTIPSKSVLLYEFITLKDVIFSTIFRSTLHCTLLFRILSVQNSYDLIIVIVNQIRSNNSAATEKIN